MRSLSQIVKKYNKDNGNWDSTTDYGILASLCIIIISILILFLYFSFDPLNFRPINTFKVYNSTTNKNTNLSNIIAINEKYKNTKYDYNKILRDENTIVSGEIVIDRIDTDSNNQYYIKTNNISFSYTMVIYLKDFKNTSEYYHGAKVKFKGKFNCIDNYDIVITEAILLD